MVDYKKKIQELEDEIKKTKYNKATQGHIGIVKAKIAQLKDKQDLRSSKKTGQSEHGYTVRKSGDGTVLLLGFPSAGKSTLLNKLTGANSEVAAYAFTTLTVVPGTMEYKQAKIQILDVPGIVSGAASGKGRGKEVLAVIQNADLVLMVVDVNHPEHYPAILKEVWESRIRLNKKRPQVWIKKKSKGGIQVGKTVPLDIDDETIKKILREFKVANAEILIRSPIDVDDLIDCVEGNKKYVPAIICVTKADLANASRVTEVKKELNADLVVSAEEELNIDPDRMEFLLAEIKKRIILNTLAHGSSMHIWKSSHHIVSLELKELSPILPVLYDAYTAILGFLIWQSNPDQMQIAMDQGNLLAQGINKIKFDEDEIEIEVEAVNFPAMLHEVNKAAIDLVICHGLPEDVSEDELKFIYQEADKYKDEFWHYLVSPSLWTRLLLSLKVTTQELPDCIMKIAQLDLNKLDHLFQLLADDKDAENFLKQCLKQCLK